MTTDTSKAPATILTGGHGGEVRYVRADIHAAMQARAEKAEATLERISQYPIPRPYFGKGVEIPDAMRGIARAALERKEET